MTSTGSVLDDQTIVEGEAAPIPVSPLPGGVVGRYVVVEEVGRGGMGRVLRAYDPKLKREVALKILHAVEDNDAWSRLIREAQAMAKLSHPNVVAVYDVEGTPPGMVYIAMEYVRGTTLKGWLRAKPRHWREVVGRFVEAARGLATAHQAGLVHRDFKPSNVLLGVDDRVRVTDFGIVRGAEAPPSHDVPRGAMDVSYDGESLTAHGTVMGTPPYMPPEQHRGAEIDARSDQFAFCVALFEGLYGVLPFVAKDLETLSALKQKGRIGWPRRARVPRWVARVLTRGLRPTPEDRWPSMDALIEALERDPGKRWRRAGATLGGIAIVGGGVGYAELLERREREQCAAEAAAIEEVWSEQARVSIQKGLHGAAVPFAEASSRNIEARLDEYTAAWSEAREDVCLLGRREGYLDPQVQARLAACFDHRRAAVESLVSMVSRADVDVAEMAVLGAATLPDLEPCRDAGEASTGLMIPDDPELRDEVAQVRVELDEAWSLGRVHREDEALANASAALERARRLGYRPLQAEAMHRLGWVHRTRTEYDQAYALLQEAWWLSGELLYDALSVDIATDLVYVVSRGPARFDEARQWGRNAAMILARMGEDALAQAKLERQLGYVETAAGNVKAAFEHRKRALEIYRAELGPEHPWVAQTLMSLGSDHQKLGDLEEAQRHFLQAKAVLEQVYGPEHPEVGDVLQSMGIIEALRGNRDRAAELFEENVRRKAQVYGEDDPRVIRALNNVAIIASQRGDDEEAAEVFGRILESEERRFGPDHPDLIQSLNNLGIAYRRLERLDEAQAVLERALDIGRASLEPNSQRLLAPLDNLGHVFVDKGEHAQALETFERAKALMVEVYGTQHGSYATTVAGAARALSGLGRHEQALEEMRSALEIRQAVLPENTGLLVSTMLQVAEAHLDLDQRDEAKAMLARAQDTAADDDEEAQTEIEDWLAEHPLD